MFIHTESSNIYGNNRVLLLPVGTNSLANLLYDNGYEVEIIHAELEKELDERFDILEYTRSKSPQIVCMDLHWHIHSYKVITLAKLIKRFIPSVKILLGGYTASYFADEIASTYKFIDFIIKGDAEIPLLKLVDEINHANDYYKVPNLVWRKRSRSLIIKDEIIQNVQEYKIDEKTAESLLFCDFHLLKNSEAYKRNQFIPFFDNKLEKGLNVFYYNCGRGCPMKCSYCAAGVEAQKLINNRPLPLYYRIETVINELKKAVSNGYNVWFASWAPGQNDYFAELFREIRNQKLDLISVFEFSFLPRHELLEEFSKTFIQKGSYITFSPETGSEKIRERNKSYYFTNKELLDVLACCHLLEINVQLNFTAGLPFERKEDFAETLKFISNITEKYTFVKIGTSQIMIEPGSPMHIEGKEMGIYCKTKTFNDFLELSKSQRRTPGYTTDFLSEEEIETMNDLLKLQKKCIQFKPFFLSYLENQSDFESIDFRDLHLQCTPCKNYPLCFKKQ